MKRNSSHDKPWAISDVMLNRMKNHAHADEHKKFIQGYANDIKPSLPTGSNHDHAAGLEEELLGRMAKIQGFLNCDSEAQYALKHYDGLEKGVLVNACKGLGTTKVKEILLRVRNKPKERIRKSRGEYLTGALRMEVTSRGIEWGAWNV